MARRYNSNNLIEDEDGNIRPNVPQIIDARAPLHDFSKDKPMSPNAPYELTAPSLTPKGIWDQMFQSRGLSNMTTASPAIAPQQPAASAFGAGLQQAQMPSLPSLTTMANGTNSAQRWMNPPTTAPASLTQFATTPTDARAIAEKYGAPGTPATPAYDWKKNFSWASAFNR